jgi:probable HAF family extracellular repeat protein
MASLDRPNVRKRFRLAAASAVLAASMAAAAATGAEAPAPNDATPGRSPSLSSGPPPRSPFPAFILTRGRYIPFEAPDPRVQLFPTGINNRGEIVGEYIIASRKESIMLRDRRGRITSFDVPGARGTEASDINDRGQIVGTYSEDTPIVNNSARPRAYLLDRFGRGKFTRIDFPGARVTVAAGVNNRGQVVGGYLDAQGTPHGYRWDKGRFTTIDVPGSSGTMVGDLNDRGEIVGVYSDDPNDPTGTTEAHGFLLSRGDFTTFDAPGVAFTQPSKINNRGQIVGSTLSDAALADFHGFLLAKGPSGPFTPIDFPGAPRTVAVGINDRAQIVGAYENPDAAPDREPSPMEMPMMMMMGG